MVNSVVFMIASKPRRLAHQRMKRIGDYGVECQTPHFGHGSDAGAEKLIESCELSEVATSRRAGQTRAASLIDELTVGLAATWRSSDGLAARRRAPSIGH